MKWRGNYPYWVCRECGLKASKGKCASISAWHMGICEVCGEKKLITEPKDFFYPKFKRMKKKQKKEENGKITF